MKQFSRVVSPFVLYCLGLLGAAEGSGQPLEGKQVSCVYNVNLDLFYLSEAQGFFADKAVVGSKDGAATGNVNEGGPAGTLGLRKAAFNFDWSLPRGIAIQMSLRPDAITTNRGEDVRELDNRSGRVIEDMPTIHLLDEFRFVIKKPKVAMRFGVEDSVLDSVRVTPDLLGFALWVKGPEKSFSAGISAPNLFALGDTKAGDTIGFGLSILSGRDERHDGRTNDSSGLGETPAKRDPYWGGALNMTANTFGGSKLVVSTAITEERQSGAKAQLQWYQAGLRRVISGPSYPSISVAMEGRQLRETFSQEGTDISDVTMTSIGVTAAISQDAENSVLLGLWAGSGEIHPVGSTARSLAAKGFQADAGWMWRVEEELSLVACLSREWRRDGVDGGGTVGGFQHGESHRSVQSRMAIQLNYRIGGQI